MPRESILIWLIVVIIFWIFRDDIKIFIQSIYEQILQWINYFPL